MIAFIFGGCSSSALGRHEVGSSCRDGYALALIVDKSRSVQEYSLVENQKRAIATIVPRLSPETELTIVAFDSAPFVLIKATEMTTEGKEKTLTRLKMIFPNGRTFPSPALHEAVRLLSLSSKSCRAMIFMSDGKFEDPHVQQTLRHVSSITKLDHVASLMLFNQGDRQAMKGIAEHWKGEFVVLNEPEQLEMSLSEVLQDWGILGY